MKKFPCVMLILDGFGVTKNPWVEKIKKVMPTFFQLEKEYASTCLSADGENVGLPKGQVGNSEAGHQTIGAGRVVLSEQMYIDKEIKNGEFEKNEVLGDLKKYLEKTRGTLHLIGLLTDGNGSGHASAIHIRAILSWVKKMKISQVYLHLITDGRDSSPHSAQTHLAEIKSYIPKQAKIASIVGRFYAMDRNRRWERSALAYEAFSSGRGFSADSVDEAITLAYARGESDETIAPTIIFLSDGSRPRIREGDAVFFWNLRSDRSRQLLKLFLADNLDKRYQKALAHVKRIPHLFLATLTDFGKGIPGAHPLFPHTEFSDTFVAACRELRQLYIAESEKFAQVTYFFNGGYDHSHFGEKRFITPSPKVSQYDKVPSMSIKEITDKIITSLQKKEQDVMVANIANPDMIAHTGNERAALRACKAVDHALLRIWKQVQKVHGSLCITSDHGNIEEMRGTQGSIDTQHNPNPVPFLIASSSTRGEHMKKGTLRDVAPTVLHFLDIPKPKRMTGKNLLK